MLRALALSLCWALAFGAGSVDSDSIGNAPLALRSDLLTVGRLEMQARALHAGNAAPPPRSAIEQALSVFYGYKDVTILDSKLAWASHWSLSPGITQLFSIGFSAKGIADGLSLVGLERALQTYLDAANAGILVEAASVNSLKQVEAGIASPGDTDRTSSRHGRSATHSLLSASVASSAGVALAFMAACLASVLFRCNSKQGDEETGDAPENMVPTATPTDRAFPLTRKYMQEPKKPNRAKDRCISYASTAATEGDDLRPMSKLTRTPSLGEDEWRAMSKLTRTSLSLGEDELRAMSKLTRTYSSSLGEGELRAMSKFTRTSSTSVGSLSTGRSFDGGEYLQCDERDEECDESSQASTESPGGPLQPPHGQGSACPVWGHYDPAWGLTTEAPL